MDQEQAEAGARAQSAEQMVVADKEGEVSSRQTPSSRQEGPPAAVLEPQGSAHDDSDLPSTKKKPPSEIVVYRDWCKACGICIEFCPTKVLDRGDHGYPIVARPEKCISCDLCELLCPDFAITLTRPLGDREE